MGTEGSSSQNPANETFDVFKQVDPPGTPLTTSEVADALDCARRTAYNKLEKLADSGTLQTKKVGARGRVWWYPNEGHASTNAIQSNSQTAVEEAQFDELVSTVTDYAIFVLDADGHVQTWNEGARQVKGYEDDEIIGEHFSTFYTEGDREAGRPGENLKGAIEEGRIEDEGVRVRSDGNTFWANVTITALYDDDGQLQGFIKITRDMTERHEYEEQLRTEKERFETLVREVKDYAIFLLDPDGIVQTWNEGAKQLKGYEDEEIIGEHFSTFYPEEDREAGRPDRNLQIAAEEGRVEDEGERLRKDGSTFWANVTITALHDDDGTLRGFAKVTRDMTERHEYEEQLREEKERFETLVREVKDYAIFMLDSDGVVQTWNEGAKELKGYEDDEIIGVHFSTFYTEDDQAAGRPEDNLQTAAEEGRVEDEGLRVHKDGDTFWANVIITALYDDDGDIRGFAKVTRDMTERHEYEERLRDQRDELDELNQINTVIRDIDQTLVSASTREEIEQAVCEWLSASETYSAAWTAEYTADHQEITPRSWDGISEDYLEAIRTADAETDGETEKGIGAKALRTQTIQSVQHLGGDATGEPWRDTTLEQGYESAVTVPLVHNEVEYGVLTVYADHESAFNDRKLAVLNELGETISHAITAIRRKEREQSLTTLQESTRRLLHTETPEDIGDLIVETLTEDFSLEDAVVYHFNTAENALEPVSSSYQADAYASQLTPLTAGTDSPVWESFMDNETRITELIIPARAMGQQRSMVVPLGDHGVLAVAAAPQETFDVDTRDLVELVAATAEAAFDRVQSEVNLRERDELLQEQNQRLQRLNQINTIIREVDQGLVQATTRDEIQHIVCDSLTESDRFRFAWIGVSDEMDDGLTPQAWSGNDRGYLDNIELSTFAGIQGAEPAVRTAETGDVTVISNVAENLRDGAWRKTAFKREFQSIISVPLAHGDVSYGVLTVYADRPNVFEEMEQSVFAELGETIANTINAVDTRESLLTDQAVELEFQMQDESTSFLARLARELGSEITFEGMIPLSEDKARLFFVAHGGDTEDLEDILSRSVAVESQQVIASTDEGHLVETVVSGQTIALTLLNHGATLRSFTVGEDGIHLLVDLPSSRDVRGFVTRFQSEYENAEFLARRERERPVQTKEGLYAELEEYLTERQLEVLKTAYYSGFFDSPRQSTGGDVADLLDVSQPTVTEQLRSAQSKVLDLLFEESSASA